MKTKLTYALLFGFLSIGSLFAQNVTTVRAANSDISDNLNLQAVSSIFGDSRDLEDFERRLNDPDMMISNLDLNGDNRVDYLRVVELAERNTHVIVLQAVLGPDTFQDVATIEVERDRYNNVTIQVVGDPYIYGPNYIYEPVYVTRPVLFGIFWVSSYRPYYSPWYWDYYPTYYNYWSPCAPYRYHNHVNVYINYRNTYNYVNTRYSSRAMAIYSPRRSNGYERMYPGRSFEARNNNVRNHYELHQNLIDPEWPLHIDRVLLFILMVAAIQFVLHYMKKVLFVCIFLYLMALLYGSFLGNYGFRSVYEDYEAMVYTMAYDPNPQDVIVSRLLPFPNKSQIIDAVDYNNPKVRNYAVGAATKYFKDLKGFHNQRLMVQCFSVFKDIRNRWTYVSDPRNAEYIASADESILHFAGDCDDHAILMAACIRAVGGTPRIIHTGGHLYPEMLIGKKADLELANYLIKQFLFVEESRGREVHYHEDEYGQMWLNLDYTATYPGGPFMSEEILGQLTFN